MKAQPLRIVPYREGDMLLIRKSQKLFIAQALRELAEVYRTIGASKKHQSDLDFTAYCFEELARDNK
jgi:hypothetical protein